MNRRLFTLCILIGILLYLGGTSSTQEMKQDTTAVTSSGKRLMGDGGNVARPITHAVIPDGKLATVPMSENFENSWPNSNSGWSLVSKTIPGPEYLWGKRNCHPHNGTSAAWSVGGGTKGLNLNCSDHYPNDLDTWAIYGPFDLSQMTSASLTFYFWGSAEVQPNCTADRLYVASSMDGQNFSQGQYFCGFWKDGTETNGYFKFTLDLASRLGQSQVYVGFQFKSNSNVTDQGFIIDDVALDVNGTTAPTPTPAPTSTPSPSADECQQQGKWYGQYFNNQDLQGSAVLTRCDANIDFYWRTGKADEESKVPLDNFSVRWKRTVNFTQAGWYRFRTFTDDGVRLYVDGERIIDDWNGQSFTENSARKQLSTGPHQITLEYLEYTNDAIAHLTWYQCLNGSGDCSLDIPAMYQTYYPNVPMPTTCKDWKNLPDQQEQQNFFNWGCLVTSWAMALQRYGVNASPTELNEWLSKPQNKGYIGNYTGDTCTANLNSEVIPQFAYEWGLNHDKVIKLKFGDVHNKDPNQLIRSGIPVIMGKILKENGKIVSSHFFLAVDVVNKVNGTQTFGVNDPWSSYGCQMIKKDGVVNCASGPQTPTQHETLLTDPHLGYYTTFMYLEPIQSAPSLHSSSTFSASIGFSISGGEILLTDNQGRRTGFDPVSKQVVDEIPQSMYFDSKIVPPGGTDDGRLQRNLILADSAGGAYTLQVIGSASVAPTNTLTTSTTSFLVSGYGFNNQYITTTAEIGGEISTDQVIEYQVDFNPGTNLHVGEQIFLPLVSQDVGICGQFIRFNLSGGIDEYPGFRVYKSGEVWFFDEILFGTLPQEGSYGMILGPQFFNEEFAPGIKWLSRASHITTVSSCQP